MKIKLLYLWYEGGTIEPKHPVLVMPKFEGGDAEGSKTQNLPLSKPIDQPSLSHLGAEILGFPLFWPQQVLFLPYLLSKLGYEIEI